MTEVTELKERRPAPTPEAWFTGVDRRLGRIERLLGRLERQVWATLGAVLALALTAGLGPLMGG